jgi:hypothetical protein
MARLLDQMVKPRMALITRYRAQARASSLGERFGSMMSSRKPRIRMSSRKQKDEVFDLIVDMIISWIASRAASSICLTI